MTASDLIMNSGVVEVVPCVQRYDWGKFGNDGLVASLYHNSTGHAIDADKPYAEVNYQCPSLFLLKFSSYGWEHM